MESSKETEPVSVRDTGSSDHDDKRIAYDEKKELSAEPWTPPQDWIQRLIAEYDGQHDGEALPPGADIPRVATSILTLNEEQALETIHSYLRSQENDYTIDQKLLQRLGELTQGNEFCHMERGDWEYETCKMAGIVHNWSPYAEVRAVTLPYDDMEETCESFRAYVLGFFWVCVVTAVNTCKFQTWQALPTGNDVVVLT